MTEKRFSVIEQEVMIELYNGLTILAEENNQLKELLKELKEKYDFEIAEEWLE